MLKDASMLHFSVTVDDLDRTLDFYGQVFGFDLSFPPTDVGDALQRMTGKKDIKARLAQMSHPDRIETLEFVSIEDQPSGTANAIPLAHFAFKVTNLEVALAQAEDGGAIAMGEVVTFSEGRSVYCRAPGGSAFELEELFT